MKETPPNNSYSRLLADHRAGTALDELSEQLAELTRAVLDRGAPGTLTFALKVQPGSKSGNAVVISDVITLKLPKIEKDETIMFADTNGALTRENPLQRKLDLREVPKQAVEVLDVPKQAVEPIAINK